MLSCGSALKMQCIVAVPPEYKNEITTKNISPNGESEYVRFKTAYEAYWWKCVENKANDINDRCDLICSGSNGASIGGGQGATDAYNKICELIKIYGQDSVQQYLKKIATSNECRNKIKPYFKE